MSEIDKTIPSPARRAGELYAVLVDSAFHPTPWDIAAFSAEYLGGFAQGLEDEEFLESVKVMLKRFYTLHYSGMPAVMGEKRFDDEEE